MDLQKIYTDSDFSNTVVPDGQLLLFNAIEDGKPVTRYKDSNGNFGTLSGGSSGADVTLGIVNDDLDFQPVRFEGTDAVPEGDVIPVSAYYSWNNNAITLSDVPMISGMQYYDVEFDLAPYASAVNGKVKFSSSDLPDGLSLDGSIIKGSPSEHGSFASSVTVSGKGASDKVLNIQFEIEEAQMPGGAVFYAPLSEASDTAETGQALSQYGEVSFGTVNGIACMTISGGYLLADTSNLPSGNAPWSISLRMRNNGSFGSNGDAHAVAYGSSNSTQAVFVGLHNNGNIYTSIHSTLDLESTYNAINSWHHTVVTFSGSTLQLWVDGVKCSEGGASATNIVPSTFKIGGHMSSGGFEFNGSIAAVRMYDRVLSEDEIKTLASEFTPTA